MESSDHQNQQSAQQQQQQQQYQQQYYNYMPTDNINTFATLHLVKGILTILLSLFFLLYIFVGSALMFAPIDNQSDMPFNPGTFIIIIGGFGFVITVVLGILTILASKYLRERRNYNFVFAIAIINCITGVLGIILGIFTLLDLNKPHVKAQFDANSSSGN